jgi:hypothetical protein
MCYYLSISMDSKNNVEAKKTSWFQKPTTKEQAVQVMNHVSTVLFVLAFLQAFMSYVNMKTLEPLTVFIAVAFWIFGVLMKKQRSYSVTVALLVFSVLNILGMLYALFLSQPVVGNIVMGVALIVMSVQAMTAASVYKKLTDEEKKNVNQSQLTT